jgi:hypothetical protein
MHEHMSPSINVAMTLGAFILRYTIYKGKAFGLVLQARIVLVTAQTAGRCDNFLPGGLWSTLVIENGVRLAKHTRRNLFNHPGRGYPHDRPNITLWSFLSLLPRNSY